MARIFGEKIRERTVNRWFSKITKNTDFLKKGIPTTPQTGSILLGIAQTLKLEDHCLIPDNTKNINDIKEAISNGYAVMSSILIEESSDQSIYHNVVIVGFSDTEYIAWDTAEGHYITLLPDELSSSKYCVGIKKTTEKS